MKATLLLCAFLALLGAATASFGGGGWYNGVSNGGWYNGPWFKYGSSSGGGRGGSYSWRPRNYYWPPSYNCAYRGCFKPCPNPTPISAWDFISSTKELSFLASLIKGTPYQTALEGDFSGTLLAPTNEAFEAYYKTFSPFLVMVLANDNSRTSTAWDILNTHFWPKLLAYHVLPEAVYAKDWKAGKWYDTTYVSGNANPHQVYFGSKGVPIKYGSTYHRYAKPCRYCRSLQFYFMDEQGNDVTIYRADKWVKGGGVVHIIEKVLQPNDIFPSARKALTYNRYTTLVSVMDYVDNSAWGNVLWRNVEVIPGTFAAPNNKAFADLLAILPNNTLPSPRDVLSTLYVHTCPLGGAAAVAENMLYTPFTSGINPAITAYANWLRQTEPKLQFKSSPNTITQTLSNQQVNIVLPDVTYPMGVAHGIDAVILAPPTPPFGG